MGILLSVFVIMGTISFNYRMGQIERQAGVPWSSGLLLGAVSALFWVVSWVLNLGTLASLGLQVTPFLGLWVWKIRQG